MSKFKITARAADIGKLNIRPEHHGDKIEPAMDIPVKVRGTKRDLDMLIPVQDGKFSEMAYTLDGACLVPHISPLHVNRKPDNLKVTIWDSPTKKTQKLEFSEAKVKNIVVELGAKHKLEIMFTLQVNIDTERDAARLVRCMGESREIEITATQDDLFDYDDQDEGQDAEGEQADIDDDQDDEGDDE